MCNSVKADYYYAEGYAKGIKTKWAANGNPSMCFEFDSDLKEFKSLSEDHHLYMPYHVMDMALITFKITRLVTRRIPSLCLFMRIV